MLFSSSNWTNRTRWQVYTTKYSWKVIYLINIEAFLLGYFWTFLFMLAGHFIVPGCYIQRRTPSPTRMDGPVRPAAVHKCLAVSNGVSTWTKENLLAAAASANHPAVLASLNCSCGCHLCPLPGSDRQPLVQQWDSAAPCAITAPLEWRRISSLPPPTTQVHSLVQQCASGGGLCSARHPKLLFQRAQFRPHEDIVIASAHHPGPCSRPAVLE